MHLNNIEILHLNDSNEFENEINKKLERKEKGVVEFPNIKTQMTKESLGFLEGCDRIKKIHGTLNGNFMKEGGDFPYYGFPEPWVGKDGKVYLG